VSDSRTTEKYHGIEVLRFAMSIVVILYHLSAWISHPSSILLSNFISYWQGTAVPVFWCLSGFIFYAVYSERIHLLTVRFGDFAIARFTRLYPLALVTLVLCMLLNELYYQQNSSTFVYHRGDSYHFILNVFMASHWGFQQFTAFNGPVWSVSVEVIIYFLFFLVARFWGNSSIIALGMIVFGKVLSHFEPNLTGHLAMSSCVQMFFWGGVVFSLYDRVTKLTNIFVFLASTLSLIGLFLVLALVPERYSTQLVPPMLVLSTQLLFRNADVRLTRFADICGSLTYSSYLLHFPIILVAVMVLDMLQIQRSMLSGSYGIAIVLAIVLLLSRATFVFFETPMQIRLRNLLLKSRTP
jgi:peptidoglycan/LPS O-acetylase OafA/YrhL